MQKYSHRLHVRLIQNGFPLFALPTIIFLPQWAPADARRALRFRSSSDTSKTLSPLSQPLQHGSQRVEIILILFGFFSLSTTSLKLSLSLFLCLSTPSPSVCHSLHHFALYIHYNTTALTLRCVYTLFNHVVISLNAYPLRDRIHQNV